MTQSFEELAKKRKRLVEASRENDMEEGLKGLLTRLYPDSAHFIYELLQNAEDAKAQKVRFTLHKDRIEFKHDGKKLFSIEDVEAITSIMSSTKRNDETQIGKFGVGFKAVFAYTNLPEIESGGLHFRIRDMVVPELVERTKKQAANGKTRFVLPFDNREKSPEQAYHEIVSLLRKLDETTVLFLTHIQKIEYHLPGSDPPGYIERIARNNSRFEIRVQQPDASLPSSAWFLKFDKTVQVEDEEDNDHSLKDCRIAVAFSLSPAEPGTSSEQRDTVDEKTTPQWKLEPIIPGRVCIYFPAANEESHLHFHLHAPFASTVARDSVLKDRAGNNILRNHLAELLAESMLAIRDQGLLTVQALALLPNNNDSLSGFYEPLMEQLVKQFKEQELVPMKRGGHAAAKDIFQGQRALLSNLIEDDDLTMLLDDGHAAPIWAANPPQRNQREDNFLQMLDITLWDTDKLVEALDRKDQDAREQWMKKKDDKWHQRLYELLGDHPNPKVAQLNLILCSDGRYRKGDECYFPTNEVAPDEKFPLVRKEVYAPGDEENKDARKFLEAVGVCELDRVEQVIREILPKYKGDNPVVPIDENIEDIKEIEKAFGTDSFEKKEQLKAELRKTPFILSYSPTSDEEIYRKPDPDQLYFPDDDLEMYFSGNSEVSFVSQSYEESTQNFFAKLGIKREVSVYKKKPNYRNFIKICDYHGDHKRGIGGFDPYIKVEGLDTALSSPTKEKSAFIWNEIASPNAECIQGTIECSTKQTYEDSRKERNQKSKHFGRLLIKKKWLPGPDGQFYIPHELGLKDLPEQFKRDKKLADYLGMKKPEEQEAAEILSKGDPRKKALINIIRYASPDELERFEKLALTERAPTPAPKFREGLANMDRPQHRNPENNDKGPNYPIENPGRYKKKLDQTITNKIEEHMATSNTIRFSPVRDRPDNKEAREFLYIEYQGRCQITGTTFPKASASPEGISENYFEACSLLSYRDASYLNDAGNMLCVSADTMAKLRHANFKWLDHIDNKISEFEDGDGKAQHMKIRISLAGEECVITWSQQHFMRLASLYENA